MSITHCRSKSQCDPPSLEKKRNRHSYIELLEEVTNELNLSAVKVDPEVSNANTDKIIQDAFNFLDNDVDPSNVLTTCQSSFISLDVNCFVLEATGPRNTEQNVHTDWIPVPAGEEITGTDTLAEMLLSVHQRKQVSYKRYCQSLWFIVIHFQDFLYDSLQSDHLQDHQH